MDKEENKGTLNLINGVTQPPLISEESVKRYKEKKRKMPSIEEFTQGILQGNRTILSQAITLIESSLPSHIELAQQILENCIPYSGKSIRIGITGVPGVGKSSFIETLGLELVNEGHRLAVLAIDPSSERSKGSILGDKTRMEDLSAHSAAFIRPSPAAGSLGGVARKTRETIFLCEAAGYDTIFVETVGVGQSETAVHSMVDFFLLLMLAGAGDELQGIKRGIMEMADAIAITKADGENISKAERAKAEYTNALHMFPPAESGGIPGVITCSSRTKSGIQDVWYFITDFVEKTKANGFFNRNRKDQACYWMYETINQSLMDSFYHDRRIQTLLKKYEKMVVEGEVSPFIPAKLMLEKYFKRRYLKLYYRQ